MKAESLIQTLRRFIAKRGVPEMLISDNVETFKKKSEWLNKLYKSREMKKFPQEKGIRWRFNLARAPWWGGLFERLVGSMKRVLRKVLKNNCFDYEELETIIVEVEGELNNRPLTYDYDGVQAEMLTTSQLLDGHRMSTLPDEGVAEEEFVDERRRMEFLTRKKLHFWNRWLREYLTDLRELHRVKGRQTRPIEEGERVLVEEENVRRGKWRLAKVERLIKGNDDIARGARVRVVNRRGKVLYLQHSIQKLYPMET